MISATWSRGTCSSGGLVFIPGFNWVKAVILFWVKLLAFLTSEVDLLMDL